MRRNGASPTLLILAAAMMAATTAVACASIASLENSPDPSETITGPAEVRESGAGPVESPVHLEGDVTITPSSLEFRGVPCGEEAPPQEIKIKNTTDQEIDYDVTAPEQSGFIIKGAAKGKVAPKGEVAIPVTALTTTATDLNGGIVVNAGKSYLEVLTHAKGVGGVIELLPANNVDFGQVRINGTGTSQLTIKNTGTGSLTINGFDGKAAGIDIALPNGPITIEPDQTAMVNATLAAGPTVRDAQATLLFQVATKLCAVSPEIKLRGTIIDTTVTLSTADFGMPACNTSPPTRTVTISNYYGPTDIQVTAASFPGGSRFSNTTGLPLTVPKANGTTPGTANLTIAVQPVGATLGLVEQDLTLTIAGGQVATATTKARVDVRGAILQIGPPDTLDFRSNGWFTDNKDFRIRNNGNTSITVRYDFVRTIGPAAWFPDRGQDTIAPGQQANISMGFRPDNRGNHQATLTPVRVNGATICNQPVPKATANGDGD
jgi:hypothetical protein